jgi:hypothetical protein
VLLASPGRLNASIADIHDWDDRAFWLAVEHGRVAVARYLIREGVDLRQLHAGLLGFAAVWGGREMSDFLASKGVTVGASDAPSPPSRIIHAPLQSGQSEAHAPG